MLINSTSLYFNINAPIMEGMESKKENSAASSLLMLSIIDVDIVIPDLEIPGITDNPWETPIMKAFKEDTLPLGLK